MKQNDFFFDKFDHDFDKFDKNVKRGMLGFGCLWLVGAVLSFLLSAAAIVALVVIILHFA